MNNLKITDRPSDDAPDGWETKYACDFAENHTLEGLGSIYADTLKEITTWLKANAFSMRNGLILGKLGGQKCQGIIWYQGCPVHLP